MSAAMLPRAVVPSVQGWRELLGRFSVHLKLDQSAVSLLLGAVRGIKNTGQETPGRPPNPRLGQSQTRPITTLCKTRSRCPKGDAGELPLTRFRCSLRQKVQMGLGVVALDAGGCGQGSEQDSEQGCGQGCAVAVPSAWRRCSSSTLARCEM